MKIGLSSYSLLGALQSGEMTILDAIQWVADQGGEHIEIVPMGFSLDNDPSLIKNIRGKAEEAGIEISNYAIAADFINNELEQEVARVKQQVDIAHQLGVKLMRHDAAWRPPSEASVRQFEADLARMAEACGEIADYAHHYGITTSVENHGFYVQAADRVQRLIHLVDRPNFKTTLDIGNFMCVDEAPAASVQKNIGYASMVHFKDFYLRRQNPGEGWMQTPTGNYLRGAIVGQGDIDIRQVIKIIKSAKYDGYLSVEFEGMEDCKIGSKIGMDNLARLWAEV